MKYLEEMCTPPPELFYVPVTSPIMHQSCHEKDGTTHTSTLTEQQLYKGPSEGGFCAAAQRWLRQRRRKQTRKNESGSGGAYSLGHDEETPGGDIDQTPTNAKQRDKAERAEARQRLLHGIERHFESAKSFQRRYKNPSCQPVIPFVIRRKKLPNDDLLRLSQRLSVEESSEEVLPVKTKKRRSSDKAGGSSSDDDSDEADEGAPIPAPVITFNITQTPATT